METNKDRIEALLRSTGRAGVEELLETMEAKGFYTAPCSSKYHLAVPGGLAEHSLNVYHIMMQLAASVEAQISNEEIIITSILHDLGKCGDHNKPLYVENILKSGKQSEAEPYKTNPELQSMEHEIRSLNIIERCIELSEDEEMAILYHNGLYGKLASGFSHPKETPLMMLLHWADLWASRVTEVE